ncbi:hypothetical protein BBJ29_000633 [Phytophthora kernoviae]|uniref:Uncharacterized protein n=1 Tax=Phytophthora kernoviae TaxID=325452 RepID=A0A3F2S072_9STRA|nr:hypothetical protein BBJ29_000633 [Phytophthora kernoviae]RLN67645.1 hypothetical protein BBP00_00001480 [Phytophthora kernoviae]
MFPRSSQILRAIVRRSAAPSAAARLLHSQPLAGRVSSALYTPKPRASPFAGRSGALRSMFIQTEPTPNPQSVKFLPGRVVLDERFTTGVDFTVGSEEALNAEIFATIMDFFASEEEVMSDEPIVTDTTILPDDDEVVAMIKELLEQRIRPSVQDDGGDIFYKGFDEKTGTVSVQLAGSCAGCPSSSVTLKQGVENMLKHYIPEVRTIEEWVDEELNALNQKEFLTLEEKLRSVGIPSEPSPKRSMSCAGLDDLDELLHDTDNAYGDKEEFSVPRLASQEQQGQIPGKRIGQNAHLPPSYRWSTSECSPREEFLVQAFGPSGFKLYGSPQASKNELDDSYGGGRSNNNSEHKPSSHDTAIPDADAELKMSVNELEEDIRGAIQQQQTSRLPDLGGLAHPPFPSSSHDHFTPNRIVSFNRSSNQDDHHTSPFGHAMDARVHSVQHQKEIEYVPQEQQRHSTTRMSPAQFSQAKSSGGVHTSTKWLRDEDERLRVAVARFGGKNWKMIAETLGNGRTDVQCLHRWNKVLKPGLIKGPWTPEEDRVLTNLITRYGVGKIRWCDLALHLPGRIGKQCRERWCNHLDSRIRKGQWTPEEDDMVFRWQQKLGNKWSEIAKMLPGRTENAVKNRFNSAARRKWLMNQANKSPGAHDTNVPMDDENMNSFLDSVALELDDIME